MNLSKWRWFRLDYPCLALLAGLLAFGVLMLWSATYRDDPNRLAQHFLRLGVSLPFLVLPLLITPHALRKNAFAIYVGVIVLLLATRFFGTTRNGSKRWLDTGVLFLQASEFVKVALVIVLARELRNHRRVRRLGGVMRALALVALPALLILAQPDLGSTMVLVPLTLAMLYAAGARSRHIGVIVLLALAAAPLAFFTMHEYQRARITSWWNQGDLSDDQRLGDGYHLHNSKIAIGSGGLLGQGVGHGSHNQLDYLPYRETDFIFPVVAEELGFVGALGLLALYAALVARLLWLALGLREPFARLLVTGVASLFATHVFLNVGVTTGLLPTTGLTLPLISYGGSSLMASFLALGMALSATLHRERVFSEESRPEFVQRLV